MRIYLDTAPIIYFVEGVEPFASAVEARLFPTTKDDAPLLVVSDLSRLECRVKPLREGDAELLRDYDEFFAAVDEVVPLSRAVVDEATQIRASDNFKTPDAMHLAAAMVSRCDIFLTNDHQLDRFTALPVEVL